MNPLSTRPNRWCPKTVFNLLVGLLFSLSALAQPAFLKDGLVAYYPFNGNANDESGNGNNGALLNGATVVDGVARFPSMPAKILVSTVKNLPSGNGARTASFWIKPSLDYATDPNIFGGYIVSWGNCGYMSTLENNTSPPRIIYGVWHGFNDVSLIQVVDSRISYLRWRHVVITKTSGSRLFSFYVDGVLVESSQCPSDPDVSYNRLEICGTTHPTSVSDGSGFGQWGDGYTGDVDDVRIYNRALSNNEVKALYDYEYISPIQSPVFVTQPVSKTVNSGDNVVLAVKLQTDGTYNYQWQLNEQNIVGATTSNLSVNNAVAGSYRYRVIVSNSAGTIISDTATLTVVTPPPPTIATQPTPKTVQEGANVTFNVVATGQGFIVYQWQFNEQNLPGATSATLNLNGVKLNTAGRYRVLVSSQYGVTISDTVTLTVNPNPPPAIVTQPVSQTVAEGTVQVLLSVTASGVGSLAYQWQINNQNISGATSSTLALNAVRPSFNGRYRVIVSSQYGVTISSEAVLSIIVFDSDSDGLSDYEELLLGTNPNKADSDGDGLSDFAEVRTHGSNPLTTDTDGDGYSDGIEVARDGNPNNRSVTPTGALAVFPAVDVEFYTLNGVKYQLEVSTDMAVWTAQGGVVVGNGGSQNHLVRASKATQFWRLKVVQ